MLKVKHIQLDCGQATIVSRPASRNAAIAQVVARLLSRVCFVVLECTSSAKEAALSIMCTSSELCDPLGSFACKKDIPILPAMHQFRGMTTC